MNGLHLNHVRYLINENFEQAVAFALAMYSSEDEKQTYLELLLKNVADKYSMGPEEKLKMYRSLFVQFGKTENDADKNFCVTFAGTSLEMDEFILFKLIEKMQSGEDKEHVKKVLAHQFLLLEKFELFDILTPVEVSEETIASAIRGYDSKSKNFWELIEKLQRRFPQADPSNYLIKKREYMVESALLDEAMRYVHLLGEEKLSFKELMRMRSAIKERVSKAWLHSKMFELGPIREIAELLPERNKVATLKWATGIVIDTFDNVVYASEYIASLPEPFQKKYGEILLRILLADKRLIIHGDIRLVKPFINREFTIKEIEQGLSHVREYSDYAHYLLMSLPKEKRTKYLEGFISWDIKMRSSYEHVIKIASLIPREVTLEELEKMLEKAKGSLSFEQMQVNRSPRSIKLAREKISEITTLIIEHQNKSRAQGKTEQV